MPALLTIACALALIAGGPVAMADQAEATQLLEQALELAQSVPEGPRRSDAIGRVAAEWARIDPRRARDLVADEMVTHEQSEAMARAAEGLAAGNQFLGLATVIRIGDRSAALGAVARILAYQALIDLDDAINLVKQIEHLTVARVVQREITRLIWAEVPGDPATAIDTAVEWAESIDDPLTHDEALAYAAEGAAGLDAARAAQIAEGISDGDARDLAWRLIVEALSRQDPAAGQELLPRLRTPLQRNLAATAVVEGLAGAGSGEEAIALSKLIRADVAESLADLRDQGLILGRVAEAIVDHDPPLALSILTRVWPPARRYATQARIASSPSHADDARRRELLIDAWVEVGRNDSPLIRAEIASSAIFSAVSIAPELIQEWSEVSPKIIQDALPGAVELLSVDRPEEALRLAELIDDETVAAWTQVQVATTVVSENPGLARSVAESLDSPGSKSAVLVALARVAMK